MFGRRALGLVAVVGTIACGSTEKGGTGSSAASGSGSEDSSGGTASGSSTASDTSGSSATSTTTLATASTGAGGQNTSGATSGDTTEASTDASSTDASSTDASSTDATGGSSAGGNGSTTTTSTDGAGGSDPMSLCPGAPPADGDECMTSSLLCAYEDCGGAGRTVAYCSGTWTVEVAPCDSPVVCSGSFGFGECASDEVCLVSAGGAISQQCIQNNCGDGPLECDCLTGCFGECTVSGSATMGLTMSCNTCPDAACP